MKFTKIDNIPAASHPNNFSVVNNGNRIDLNLVDWIEPNNGRMLHVAKFMVNTEDRTTDYLGNWNWVLFGLTKFQFNDPEKRFCFIPVEAGFVLVDVTSLSKMTYTYPTISFIGNIFYGDKLLIVCVDGLIITDLKTFKTVKYPFEGAATIEWAYFINPDQIRVIHHRSNECSLFDLKTGKILETRFIAQEGADAWIVKHYKQENGKNILQIIWKGAEANQTANFQVED
jgi:hypothetical protein